jgi:ABC-type uncharacterized transport system substrate-binding protein
MVRLMPRRLLLASFLLSSLAALLGSSEQAGAHPHVWVTMKSELIYAPDGSVTGIREAWTFDDMYSAYATEGLPQKAKGAFTREELAALAETNVTALKEYEYFTYAKAEGKKAAFGDPVDYWLDYKDQMLTLNFTLPFKSAVKAKLLQLEVFDPEFFVDFSFAAQEPVRLVDAPATCKADLAKPNDGQFPASQRLDRSLQLSEANAGMGANFANKIMITCP